MHRKKTRQSGEKSLRTAFALDAERARAALAPQPLVHPNCRGTLRVENCRGNLAYSSAAGVLDLGGVLVRIEGDGLVMDSFQKAYITLRGRIFAVRLEETEEMRGKAQKPEGR